MASKHNKNMRDQKERTLDQVDETFKKKILSRSPSMGDSSPLFHDQKPRGVAFKWEIYPGKPKEELMQPVGNSRDPQNDEITPSLSPSPEAHSPGKTRPIVTTMEPPRVRLWKKTKKNHQINKVRAKSQETNVDANGTDNFGRLKSINSDVERVMPLSRSNTTGSSIFSSSISSSNGLPSKSSKFKSLARGLIKWSF